MRTPLVAGNWKMHGHLSANADLLTALVSCADLQTEALEVLVCPPSLYLAQAHSLLAASAIQLGAQNFHPQSQGAFTGEIAAPMLQEFGVSYALVGHSERRSLFAEDDTFLLAKCQAAFNARITPILCVGESLEEYEQGQGLEIVKAQVTSVVRALNPEEVQSLVIAYEPVWAIGTGLTATPEYAQQVHAAIRDQVAHWSEPSIAQQLRILYGGSVKPENAAALFAMPDVDGALVGGASLEAASFIAICQAAAHTS